MSYVIECVHIDDKLEFETHTHVIVLHAYQTVNLIFECFLSEDLEEARILEHVSSVCSQPHKNLKLTESEQKHFVKSLSSTRNFNYTNR